MKKQTRVLSVILTLAMLSCPAAVTANEPSPPVPPISIAEDGKPQPYSTCFSFAYATLTPKGNQATCTATLSTREGYTYEYDMALIRSTDKDSAIEDWDEVKSWSGSGEAGPSASAHSTTMTKGYYYCVKLVLSGYGSDGIVETYTAYSSIKDYTA